MVAAEVRVERRLDVAVLPYFSEHFLHHRLAFDLFGWAQLIKFVEPLEAFCLYGDDVVIVWHVQIPCVHSFLHDAHRAVLLVVSKAADPLNILWKPRIICVLTRATQPLRTTRAPDIPYPMCALRTESAQG